MRAEFRVRITPADVGQRVTVRYRRDAPEGEPQHSDAVGTLESWEGGQLRLRDRRGATVTVPEQRLVAGRAVGPPPRRRGSGGAFGTGAAG